MGRSPCCDKVGLKKGPWTPEEDQKLLAYIEEHGHGSWRALPSKAGLQRCGKSCRLRWTNYLRPDIKRGKFSLQEEQTIIQLHALLGNRWSAIATHLPKRTDNEIKNYWNTHLKKRLTKMGIDPVTHKPKNDALLSSDGQSKTAANLSHMAQWESARLEAEARLVRESKLRSSSLQHHHHHHHLGTSSGGGGASTFASSSSPSTSLLNNNNINKQEPPPPLPTTTTTAATTITTQVPIPIASSSRSLDVLKAWNNGGWLLKSNEVSNNNNGGGVGDLESPTSTLSFSENAPPIMTTTTTTSGGGGIVLGDNTMPMIEFVGSSGSSSVKEEGSEQQEWNKGYETSMTYFMCGSSFTIPMEGGATVTWGSHDDNDHDDDESLRTNHHNHNHNDHHHHHNNTIAEEGFTSLLLNNTNSRDDRSLSEGGGDSNSGGSGSGGGGGGGGDFYEDNKNYWNSILNLVNSSPSDSPMF